MSNSKVSLVVAYNHQRVIGHAGQIPWHLPADLQYFKRITMGKPIVMGRKTHESIGRALPGRRNLVISRQARDYAGCECFTSLEAAMKACADDAEVMVIGGGELYGQALPWANRLYVTEVDHEGEGDAYFPDLGPRSWRERSRESHAADAKNRHAYSFVVWERVKECPSGMLFTRSPG